MRRPALGNVTPSCSCATPEPTPQMPFEHRRDADRWILALFVAWTQLQKDDGERNVNGGDLMTHLG
ncbi:hypothetical protein H7X46_07870 [Pseudonocardia sp. C8]|uniref:hypothetical protein n=1 Tax=Pseudonocardia sp. C8 TaxID=2762759 RepID=UPI001642F247|nr:hypothetical protein [Pseudonocardia sp. C8]MBC3190977.1 hypothetical protein [Pseudonocardia sp. C8]